VTQTTTPHGTPPAEVDLSEALVRALLRTQHPDLAELPLERVDAGWDNVMFRVGNELCLRFPRRRVAAALLNNEQRWLPVLGSTLPIPIPVPLRTGGSGEGYPWNWSVIPWLPGRTADLEAPNSAEAIHLAAFLHALHQPAPIDAPENMVRGVPLRDRKRSLEQRMQRLGAHFDLTGLHIRPIWESALDATIDVSDRWLHGDLHPRNVLVAEGRITGIIDWGDITSGDVATDLASIWMLFAERIDRVKALNAYGEVSDATLRRAKGWAVLFGIVLLDTGLVDNPRHAEIGRRTLLRVAEDR
jgi:aminoglycoside phosphotransferase (APT) family kinase protein